MNGGSIRKGVFIVSSLERTTAQALKKQKIERTGECPVWCVTVPNSFFVVRRNNHTYVTGNCNPQGVNGDSLKLASILMDDYLQSKNAAIRIWVHDEVLVEAPKEYSEEVALEVQRCMKQAAYDCGLHKVKIETSCEMGLWWVH